jgi:hypothetical protein
MFNDESLESQSRQQADSLSSDAVDWGRQFIKCLELEYTNLASELPADATWPDFQQAMMIAVGRVFDESGATPERIAQLWEAAADCLLSIDADAAWNREKNARRLNLIDKKIQQTITPKEAIELARLTAQMRVHCDSEKMVPLEGARQLHRRLLDMDES